MTEATYQSLPATVNGTADGDGHHEAGNGEHSTLLFKGGSWQSCDTVEAYTADIHDAVLYLLM